ncbi:hypothetical protein AKJ40_03645 [candidate division MSBL1 archaeon SCGC-AAA259M10]|uniref:Metallo-beta-lactamase domain-containing protein n=1 Tax=candidate division MSBL1 archaeon SCGC-AAA259M10 TaxID=1698270 RepID=A0A133UYF7_9EURY|nr:hypothetical protein AKJ40_03645 [candidate division MSBL1 archaeon SCGC-AAA259M10]
MNSVTCYGGVGEIGGNKILLELDDSSIFLDFGLNFGKEKRFFEEYLQPRTESKLHDLLSLDLLPGLDGIYRGDAMCPEGFERLEDNPSEPLWECELQSYENAVSNGDWHPDAVFISHAHMDHCGYVPFLGDVSLICSPATRTLMESITEIGNLFGFDGELVKMRGRCVDTYSRGYFPGAAKIKKEDEASRMMIELEHGDRTSVGPDRVTLEAIEVGHSVPGALAGLVESEEKQVVYTGDLRFHGRTRTGIVSELGGLRPDVMLCEGTRIDEDQPDDEEQVEKELVEVFSDARGLAMVGFAWKDLERYETVKDAAEKAGRTPVFDPRLAYLKARLDRSLYEEGATAFVERSGSMLYSPGDYTRSKHKAGEIPVSEWDSRAGIKDTTHLEKGVTAKDIRESPEEYVLHLDYYRFKNLIDLDPLKGSIYVRAQSEPFNIEMELSEKRLKNWLRHFEINEEENYEPIQIHASGHACGREIQEMVDAIKPKKLIPIHTQNPDAFENEHGEVIKPKMGKTIEF